MRDLSRRLKDKLTVVHALDAVQAAYVQVSAVQQIQPEQQVAGAALLFSIICETAGLDVSEVLNQVRRMQADVDSDPRLNAEVRALRMYVQEELKS